MTSRVPGLRPFLHRDFTLYWSGLAVSQIGEWIETTTTAWLLYEITRSPVLLGLAGGVRALATILFGLVGGAVADRVSRRKLVMITQSGFAISSLVLGTLVVTGLVAPWHIYLFSAVNASLGAFDAPARKSLFPSLVPRSEMQSAISLNASVSKVGKLVGPGIAGLLIASSGPAVCYFLNVASYGAILAALRLMASTDRPARLNSPLIREAVDGLQYAFRRPVLRTMLVLETAQSFFGVNTALITIFASDVLRAGPEGLGLLLSAQATGAAVGATILVVIGDIDRKGAALVAAAAVYCAAYGLLAGSPGFGIAAVLLGVLGLSDIFWSAMRSTVFQLRTEDEYRGRTMGVLLLAGRGFSQGSQLETGAAVSLFGPRIGPLLNAAVLAAVLVGVNAQAPEVRRLRGVLDPLGRAATIPAGEPPF